MRSSLLEGLKPEAPADLYPLKFYRGFHKDLEQNEAFRPYSRRFGREYLPTLSWLAFLLVPAEIPSRKEIRRSFHPTHSLSRVQSSLLAACPVAKTSARPRLYFFTQPGNRCFRRRDGRICTADLCISDAGHLRLRCFRCRDYQ